MDRFEAQEALNRFKQMSATLAWKEYTDGLNSELKRLVGLLKKSDGTAIYRQQGAIDNLEWMMDYESRLQIQAAPDDSSADGASEDTPKEE